MTIISELHDYIELAMDTAKYLFQDNQDLADAMGSDASPFVYKQIVRIVWALEDIYIDVPTNIGSSEEWESLCRSMCPDDPEYLSGSQPAFKWSCYAADEAIDAWNRRMISLGRTSVFVTVSTLDRYDECSLSLYWEKRGFTCWHEAAYEIAKQICREYYTNYGRLLQPEFPLDNGDLQAWIYHWSETDWAEILQGLREEWIADEVSGTWAEEEHGEDPSDTSSSSSIDDMVGPKSPAQWEKLFRCSWRTVRRHIDRGAIRARKVHAKSWWVHREDVPRT